ncbi:hypothetical protein [Dictyobacter arantiisoli]|uniref:Uncharacterized protein n=1 Tax=Dictyobacter arantiisoli TaxID=2014874 RepID=A0A5A5TKH1_9CHLR|nr:hypothetical protein [Dictyobacter arantiisoli]GCF11772.1 hypothetical protein KDI_53360 [Dictyobacter arantiisoli]
MSFANTTIIVVFVIACVTSFFTDIREYQKTRLRLPNYKWYKQPFIQMGNTTFFLALFFLLIGWHDSLPDNNISTRSFVFMLALVVLLVAAVSCLFMLRYFKFFQSKE